MRVVVASALVALVAAGCSAPPMGAEPVVLTSSHGAWFVTVGVSPAVAKDNGGPTGRMVMVTVLNQDGVVVAQSWDAVEAQGTQAASIALPSLNATMRIHPEGGRTWLRVGVPADLLIEWGTP